MKGLVTVFCLRVCCVFTSWYKSATGRAVILLEATLCCVYVAMAYLVNHAVSD